MTWNLPALALGLALALIAPTALAAHMTQYHTNPVEHDDQGRANEPDGARGGLYDGGVADCTVDLTGDGRCSPGDLALWPAGKVVAQGCTDDTGRQPSGACGLFTIGIGTGPTGTLVPPQLPTGDPGPCGLLAGQRPVRLLDVHETVYPAITPGVGLPVFEVNRKLQDAGIFTLERQAGLGDGSDVAFGGVGMFAWYGIFFDRNCNGVIDHFGTGQSDPRNEFTWIGDDCINLFGVNAVPPDVCRAEAGTEVLGWEVPGNHHADYGGTCLGPECGLVFAPADLPGRLVLCTLAGGSAQGCDAEEAVFSGDPLLGPQDSSAPDWYFYPYYLGDANPYNRVYVAANNWPMYHYDPSVVVTMTVFGAVSPPRLHEATYDLGQAAFVDVDVLKTRHPALEAYLQTLVKPTLRSAWLTVREAWP